MENKIATLNKWVDDMLNSHLPEYKDLPEVKLYMDQLVGYVNERLAPFAQKDQEAITKFMINNYVKNGLIPPPTNKRYSKNQIGYIIAICILKQSASLTDLSIVMDKHASKEKPADLYTFFKECERETLENVHHKTKIRLDTIEKKYNQDIQKCKDNEALIGKVNSHLNSQLIYVAFKLLVEAQMNKFFAERILEEVVSDTKNS